MMVVGQMKQLFVFDRERLVLLVLFGTAVAMIVFWNRSEQHIETPDPRTTYRFQIDPETASGAEWQTLPGIGETLAERIVEERQSGGSFKIPNDIRKVKGIGEKKLERIRPFLVEKASQTDNRDH